MAQPTRPLGIDPRGPRIGAGITAILLIAVVLMGGLDSVWPSLALLAVVAAGFAVGAVRGPQGTWQGAIFRVVIQPRLGPTSEREDPRPPTFAQLVGLLITGIGVLLGLLAATGVWPGAEVGIAISAFLALIAALLNSIFGLCLGCELYVVIQRAKTRRTKPGRMTP